MIKRQMSGWLLAGVLAAFVSNAVAQSATAYSSSAVGVIKKTLPAGGRILLSVPLDQESDAGSGFEFGSIPAFANLPNMTAVYFWDVTNQTWITRSKSRGSWGTAATRLVAPGESFFLVSSSSTNIDLVISGEVPADSSISRAIVGQQARSLNANPYPVPVVLTNLTFTKDLANMSAIYFWDVDNQTWVTASKSRGSWGTQKDRVITPGEGFFVVSYSNDTTWVESRPYTWPN